jgi:hypothetical protein
MKHLPIYIIIALLLVLLTCNKPNKHTVSTIAIHDTIIRVDTFNHTDIVVDTVVMMGYDTIINNIAYPVNKYEYKINDSLLDGVIVATSPFRPKLDFKYTLKSFEVKETIIKRDLRGFYYGGELVLLNQAFIGLGYMNNKGDLLNLSVGKDFATNTNLIKAGFYKRF